ncbi:D-alanine--D-alanine ligase family protein [Pseudomonas shirazensis]|uniref:D-alanine--D-alanine ligase n=1 Tax=Pseudomonas shirazensis TaxID=2745494 RepID=A0ABU8ZXQ0_9PSED|nr:D-alanine--D-alanine ligase family protein [Pseudomonas shirazensis]MBV4499140.1 D-alanine--D-alanine ligase [Pseudomonas shirazensis]
MAWTTFPLAGKMPFSFYWILDTVAKDASLGAKKMKQNVIALIFGGRSTERSVSLRSAATIHAALVELGKEVHCIGIDEQGIWRYLGRPHLFPENWEPSAPVVSLRPGSCSIFLGSRGVVDEINIDILFPALHGRWGEDGTIQGLAAMCGIPCVGSGVLGSAVSMDKDIAKRLLQACGIRVAPWVSMRSLHPWGRLVERLGSTTLFIKPANSGSSIGISRVTDAAGYAEAYALAVQHDRKVLAEAEIVGREIECGVLERGDGLFVSSLGEIIKNEGQAYYDYEAKYDRRSGAELRVPAVLPLAIAARIQEYSKQAFECLDLRGLARVDFFLTDEGEVILNEVNTLPGFTSASMYPRVLEYSGHPMSQLVEILLRNACLPADGEGSMTGLAGGAFQEM